ncbi:YkgJ family cysteine cluster protein [Pseudomonas alkylphenolica]|nr:YkgJ family cysteine cluster protein [Pseudomonas alkylphenolica]
MKKYLMGFFKSVFNKNVQEVIPAVALLDKNTLRVLPPIPDSLVREHAKLGFELQNKSESKFDKIRRIYDFLNLYNNFARTFTVCGKGCSACCKVDVSITKLEAIYIEKNTGRVARRTKKHTRKHKSSCPFLVDNNCSVYDYRPFNCRTLYTLDDPKYCETKESHQLYGASGGAGIKMIYVLKEFSEYMNGNNGTADIRDYFH